MGTFSGDRTGRMDRDDHERRTHEVLYPPQFHPEVPDPELTEEALVEPAGDRVTRLIVTSGSSFELMCGVVAVVFAIFGLLGYAPIAMAALATVAVGSSLLAQGLTIAARWREAVRIAGSERTDAMGIGTEIFGGIAGIVLGLLAILGLMPLTLLPAAALVLGIALLLGGPTQPDIAELAPMRRMEGRPRWVVSRRAVRTSSGVMVMGGLAAIVLGVLASAGLAPAVPLSLISLLSLAVALMLSGGTLLARFAGRSS